MAFAESLPWRQVLSLQCGYEDEYGARHGGPDDGGQFNDHTCSIVMRLPDRFLIRDGVKKFILREVGRHWLPDVVYSHPKVGFTIPLHMLQNDNYDKLCRRYITESKSAIIAELFDRNALLEMVAHGSRDSSSRRPCQCVEPVINYGLCCS